jgi:hypothetical protein
VFAYTYFMMGRHDAQSSSRRNHGLFWALASIIVTVAVIEGFGGGWLSVVVSQILLFVAITGWRVAFEK